MCRSYQDSLRENYPKSSVTYAGKAYIDPTILKLIASEDFGLDVVSGGEIACAVASGFPMERVVFHGNNKLEEEIKLALSSGVGRFAVDGLDDLNLISRIASAADLTANILLRLTPGISAHTHEYIRTGALDSKFGIPISTDQADEVVQQALDLSGINLIGYHAHIGSQIFDTEPFAENVRALLRFSDLMHQKYGILPEVISPGGGCGVQYLANDAGLEIQGLVEIICQTFKEGLPENSEPELVLEPGRSIVANAGVALYTIGTMKDIPGIRAYAAVDGGMADNIRPALYGAQYSAVIANRVSTNKLETVTVAGRYCESGDVVLRDINLPPMVRGDILAIPAAGAYHMAMASNYNLVGRPATVLVNDGTVRVTRPRETDEDLLLGFSQPKL